MRSLSFCVSWGIVSRGGLAPTLRHPECSRVCDGIERVGVTVSTSVILSVVAYATESNPRSCPCGYPAGFDCGRYMPALRMTQRKSAISKPSLNYPLPYSFTRLSYPA